ncbi:MAG TPA: alpha/beta hydrolase [Gemmatimonadaceae bacterium]|nr:alpha/beta hydrolase [Gemmatimonadaceae bacterium]
MTVDFERIATNGIRLNVACAGPSDGPLIVLLHGFPEFWYSWRRQIEPLAVAGFRVLAPDMRGYNLSDKPRGLAAYRIDRVAADIVGLIDHAGREKAVVVGHDWGGAVAWSVAMRHADRVERLVVLNCGHPAAMIARLRTDSRQRRKSWYIFLFQVPWLPETYARAKGFRSLVNALRATSKPGTFSDVDISRYRQAWSQPGAMTAMINYYRATLQRRAPHVSPRIRVPTRIIWGTADAFLLRELAGDSLAFCDRGTVTYLDASHWVQHELADEVTRLIAAPD